MNDLPIPERRRKAVIQNQNLREAEPANTAETWMMALLIVLVPVLGGVVYHSQSLSAQRARLSGELAAARSMAREVVDELVQMRVNLDAREAQVNRLLEATTLADQQMREMRGAITDWQDRHESLASAASRKIAELAAQSDEAGRRLDEEKNLRDSERTRLENSLAAVSNQLSATDSELQGTRDFAREAARWNEHLERGVYALRKNNDSLSSSLSSAQSQLASAESEADSARSEASSAESERDRARYALGHAEGVISSLKHVVVHERREEAREHRELVHAPIAQSRPHPEPPRPAPSGPPERHDPPGARRPK